MKQELYLPSVLERLRWSGSPKVAKRFTGSPAEVDFFGEEGFTRVDGAGGGKWTERLDIPFQWLAAA
jgi:hypothetical protein